MRNERSIIASTKSDLSNHFFFFNFCLQSYKIVFVIGQKGYVQPRWVLFYVMFAVMMSQKSGSIFRSCPSMVDSNSAVHQWRKQNGVAATKT